MGAPTLAATPPRAALLLAALALVLLLGPQTCGAAASVDVKTTVEEDLKMRRVFPWWAVAPGLLSKIATEPGVKAKEQLRARHQLLYRGTLPYSDVKKVCAALKSKRQVTITATKKSLKETVRVAAATAPCAGNFLGTGAAPNQAFQILLKRLNVPLKNTYTVLRCAQGSLYCYIYRLYKPCRNGRCRVPPDPTLASSVFSDITNLIESFGSKEAALGRFQDPDAQCTESDENCQTMMDTVGAFVGVVCATPECRTDSLAAFKASIKNVIALLNNPDTQHEVGTTTLSDMTPKAVVEQVLGDLTVKKSDDIDWDTFDFSTPTEPSINWVEKGKVNPARDQGECASGWAIASVSAMEARLAIDNNANPADFLLSVQQVLDCARFATGDSVACGMGDQQAGTSYTLYSGIHLESNYPYTSYDTGEPGECKSESLGRKVRARVTRRRSPAIFKRTGPGTAIQRQKFLKRMLADGPVLVFIKATTRGNVPLVQSYQGGILSPALCDTSTPDGVNLAALLVGYNDDEGSWILQSPLGPAWGENGLFKLGMTELDEDNLGPCGLYTAAVQPMRVELGEEDPKPTNPDDPEPKP